MRKFGAMMLASASLVLADYETGKKIFEKKCSECHAGYIEGKKIIENFYEKENKLLNLKAPTVNMLAYAIMDGPKKIGDPKDPEMQKIEIENFLKDYLTNPNLENSICDPKVIRFYKVKDSLKGKLNDEEFSHLADFFMQYQIKRLEEKEKNKK